MLCIHWLPMCGCKATRLMDRRWAVFVAQLLSFYGLFSTWKSCPLASSSSIPTGKYKPHCLPKDAPLWETHDSFTAWPLPCAPLHQREWGLFLPTQHQLRGQLNHVEVLLASTALLWVGLIPPQPAFCLLSLLTGGSSKSSYPGRLLLPISKGPSTQWVHGALPSKNWVDAVCLSVNTSSNEVFKITLQIDQQIDHIHVVTTMGQGLWLWWRH